MDITAIVNKVLPPTKGTSTRGEWIRQDVIFEMPDDFNRKLCVSFWGDKAAEVAALTEGERVTVSVNLESREFNGRWYTDVKAWRMIRNTVQQAPEAQSNNYHAMPAQELPPLESTPPQENYNSSSDQIDDLPF